MGAADSRLGCALQPLACLLGATKMIARRSERLLRIRFVLNPRRLIVTQTGKHLDSIRSFQRTWGLESQPPNECGR